MWTFCAYVPVVVHVTTLCGVFFLPNQRCIDLKLGLEVKAKRRMGETKVRRLLQKNLAPEMLGSEHVWAWSNSAQI